ncbi:MAG: adenylosuccinate lyase [Patescibacteria group bacterium]
MLRKNSPRGFPLAELSSVTPLDGRYREKIEELSEFTSEFGLIKIRVEVEIKYLIALSEEKIVRKISPKEKSLLLNLINKLSIEDAEKVKEIENETRHDVKAVERFLRNFLKNTTLRDIIEFIHFGLTSEDINNISYRLILKRATGRIIIPVLLEIINELCEIAEKNKKVVMLARTHGQPAVPTTLGKEIVIFADRLNKQFLKLKDQNLTGKITGAVGNYNSLKLSYPKTDWIKFSEKFVNSLGLTPNIITTQINPYDDFAQYFQTIERINNILIDFSQDAWRYISDGWFTQKVKKGEVGSSAMPQKVNPIDFENSEGNLGMANSILEFMARKLPVSRLQRDLSDSTVIRNIGTALGFSLIGYKSLLIGLSRITPNIEKISEDLNNDWSILAEAAQTLLRKEGVTDPYSMLLSLTRGKHIKSSDWKSLINKLKVDKKIKDELVSLTPEKYIGLSVEITEKAIKEIKQGKSSV